MCRAPFTPSLVTFFIASLLLGVSGFAQPQDLGALSSSSAQELTQLDFFSNGQGMHLSPGVLNKLETLRKYIDGTRADESVMATLAHRWGLQENDDQLVGIKTVRYKGMKIGVLGCVACHSGKAAGQYIVGIGNKNIDPGQIGIDGVRIEKAFKEITDVAAEAWLFRKNQNYRDIEDSSIKLMKKLGDPRLSSGTQGMVPVSLVGSWFYEMANAPLPENGFKGAVKVPSWFGFKKKSEVGQFSDGLASGHPPGWIVGVEITSGQTVQNIRDSFSNIEHAADLIGNLMPPKYPFAIDVDRANKGKTLFEETCARCHGTYEIDVAGYPIYQAPKMIPIEKIGTDTDRLDYVTDDFLDKVRSNPLSDLIQLSQYAGKRMYVAPRLHAIWARFPYLHNGSVPTLRDMLEPATNRPKLFSLKDAGEKYRFDPNRMGLKSPASNEELIQLVNDTKEKRRWIYDTAVQGQSNQGHEKFLDLKDDEKDSIVEYLKTL